MNLEECKKVLPGWMLLVIIGLASNQLSGLIEVGGKHPVEAAVIAILIGLGLRNAGFVPVWAEGGVKKFEKLLDIVFNWGEDELG